MLNIINAGYVADQKTILAPQNMTIMSGQHLLLLGPSGCGKTTLMNLAAGLLRASAGDVVYEGQHYADMSDAALDKLRARNFGFVFQRLHLIGHLSVAQNIAVAEHGDGPSRIEELLADLGLSGRENSPARDLSVGEAQRVAIARAVANNPKIIFADEPTSALDDANAKKVMDMIFAQAEKTGATVIAATHDGRIKPYFTTIRDMSA